MRKNDVENFGPVHSAVILSPNLSIGEVLVKVVVTKIRNNVKSTDLIRKITELSTAEGIIDS